MMTAEQVVAAHKANVETLFGLTNKAFEGVEKLVELNLQVAKAALGEVADNTRAALSVKDAQELLALQATMLQPAAEKAASYSRHVYDIAAATQAEVAKVAEAQIAEAQKNFASTVDTALKNAPAGKAPTLVIAAQRQRRSVEDLIALDLATPGDPARGICLIDIGQANLGPVVWGDCGHGGSRFF